MQRQHLRIAILRRRSLRHLQRLLRLHRKLIPFNRHLYLLTGSCRSSKPSSVLNFMPNQPSSPLTDPSTTEHRVVNALPSAILLALTGGSLDAFIYLNHGHVFAAAMTGNGVLLGVSIFHHDYAQTVRHLLPIFGFIVGVFFANLLDKTLKHHAVVVGLVCESPHSSSPHSFPAASPI